MPFDEVRSRVIDRHRELNSKQDENSDVEVLDTSTGLAEKLELILPLAIGGVSKVLVSETKSQWSIYMENQIGGTEIFNQPTYYAEKWPVDIILFVCSNNVIGGQPGSTQFYYARSAGKKIRWVSSHRESRWEFDQSGEPLPFEELEAYDARRIKDRLTPDMLERYANHFGIELFDPDFYAGRGAVISRKSWAKSYVDKYPNLSGH